MFILKLFYKNIFLHMNKTVNVDSGCCSHLRALLQELWPLIIHNYIRNILSKACGRLCKWIRYQVITVMKPLRITFIIKKIECDIICHDQDSAHILNAEPGRKFFSVLLSHGWSSQGSFHLVC